MVAHLNRIRLRTMSSANRVERRSFFGYAGALGVGAASGLVAGRASAQLAQEPTPESVTRQVYSAYGTHQSGITTPAPAAHQLIAFDLLPKTDPEILGRLLRLWSGSIDALMAGRPIPGDMARDLAQPAVSMSITVGLGPGVFELPGLESKRPTGFQKIPAMDHDKLDERWCGGDLLLSISADDQTSVAYAARRLISDAATFATPRWLQQGSWRGADAEGNRVTGRNLFGQVDGTANPTGAELAAAVWSTEGWLAGGTQLVIRRVEMNLDKWDTASREIQEKSMGRRLSDGAPLSGGTETDDLDLAAKDDGELVIPLDAHARLAHPSNNKNRLMLRRGLNYTYNDDSGLISSGLIFQAFVANLAEQFIPVQQTLDQSDAMNEWLTPIGSAVFVIPPGFTAENYLGKSLLEG